MTNALSDWIIVGRFGRPHGIKGYVIVNSFTEPRDNLLNYPNWHGFINNCWQPLDVLDIETHHTHIIAQVKHYASREEAASLTHVDIAVPRTALPVLPQGEYYWHQLLNMQVVTQEGNILGYVQDIMPTGSNDVLVISGEKRHLIPYLPGSVVLNVNESTKMITVDWDLDF